jgi:hypothetical protein
MLALTAIAGLVVPPIAAAIAKRQLVPAGDETADEVSLVSIFEATRLASRATSFRGGSALCWYGALDLDLRGATLHPSGARLRVVTIFGGTRVIVPDGWQVRVRPVGIMGGASDETSGRDAPGPALDVDAIAVFGGIQVATRFPDDDELRLPTVEVGGAVARAETLARAEADASLEVEAPADELAAGAASGRSPDEAPTSAADASAGPSGPNGT